MRKILLFLVFITLTNNSHSNEKQSMLKFNASCVECHPNPKHRTVLSENSFDCVSCHMPLESSKLMKIQINLDSISPVQVRTHRIGIYIEGELLL